MSVYSFIIDGTKYATPVSLLDDTQNLPTGFKRLKYIQLPDNPVYLSDANVSTSGVFGYEIEFQLENVTSQTADNIGLIGCEGLSIYFDSTGIVGQGSTESISTDWTLDEAKHTIKFTSELMGKYSLLLDEVNKGTKVMDVASGTNNIYIGNVNTDDDFTNMKGKIYFVKYYTDGTEAVTFYPALRTSDNVAGLYKFTGDTATGFITTATSKQVYPKETFTLYCAN